MPNLLKWGLVAVLLTGIISPTLSVAEEIGSSQEESEPQPTPSNLKDKSRCSSCPQ